MIYVKKPEQFEAFFYDGLTIDGTDPRHLWKSENIPDWLSEAQCDRHLWTPQSSILFINRKNNQVVLFLPPGSYIVRDVDGKLYTFTKKEFEVRFRIA